MIAGELEGTLNYNNFFSKKNKSTSEKPKMNLLQKAGKAIDKVGGVEGIGRTVDSVRNLFRKTDPATQATSDFQFGLKQNEPSGATLDEQNKEKQKKEKQKLIIIGIVAVSGIILIGAVVWYLNRNKQQAVSTIK